MDDNDLALLEKLGPEGVLLEMAKGGGRLGRPGSPVREEISHWLMAKYNARSEAASAANLAIASRAERRAKWANIIAIIAVIIAAKDQIASAVSWLIH